jgi:4-amino-4-deoxy-L-arabinose transferase-like glycosyltransferase
MSQIDPKVKLSVFIIILFSVFVRLWLVGNRWINPDEGAHLMDASLVIDGYVPILDFHSRQPFYTYLIAGFLKIFGAGLIQGRLLPLICSLLVALLIYHIGKMLYDKSVGFLSAAIYMLLPLEIYNSMIVKTEPLVTLLICLSFFLLQKYFIKTKAAWLFLSGAIGALGYYVRQSALIVPLTAFVLLAVHYRKNLLKLIPGYGRYMIGYLTIVGCMLLFFSQYYGPEVVYFNALNPLSFILEHFGNLFSLSTASAAAAKTASGNIGPNYGYYIGYVLQAFYMHAFIIAAFCFAAFGILQSRLDGNKKIDPMNENKPSLLLYTWVLSLCLAYSYYFLTRGFYIDYFREFLPPLCIVCAAWLLKPGIIDRMSARKVWIGAFVGILLIIVHTKLSLAFGMNEFALYACIGMIAYLVIRCFMERALHKRRTLTIIIAISMVLLMVQIRSMTFSRIIEMVIWVTMAVLVLCIMRAIAGLKVVRFYDYLNWSFKAVFFGALLSGISYSASIFGLSYDSPYSLNALEEAADFLEQNTKEGDEVLSGAVIWEFEADRRPFQNLSHPLAFIVSMSDEEKEVILNGLAKTPPAAIIMDGYTERTYLPHIKTRMTSLLTNEYKLIKAVGPAKYPVRLYLHKNHRSNKSTNNS